MALNEPRKIPFDFRVVEFDGYVWLYDNSERSYLCSAQPTIWLEPLYEVDGDSEDYPDPCYVDAGAKCFEGSQKVLNAEAEEDPKDAWDSAREEAQANHIL